MKIDREPSLPGPEQVLMNDIEKELLALAEVILHPDRKALRGKAGSAKIDAQMESLKLKIEDLAPSGADFSDFYKMIINSLVERNPGLALPLVQIGAYNFKIKPDKDHKTK